MDMTTNRLITILLLVCVALGASAKKKQDYNTEYEKMNRLDMLRAARHYKENSNAMFKAATGTELGGVDAPVTEESRKYDYLETDYH